MRTRRQLLASLASVGLAGLGGPSTAASGDGDGDSDSGGDSAGDGAGSVPAPIEVDVRASAHLAERARAADADADPVGVLARYIERALGRLDVPYAVGRVRPVPADAMPPASAGKDAQWEAWVAHANEAASSAWAKDATIVLTDRAGGGIARVGAAVGLAAGGPLVDAGVPTDAPLREWVPADRPHHCVYGCLHELGHLLEAHPDHATSWGRTWVDHDAEAFYRTPLTVGGPPNLCGQARPTHPEGYARRDVLTFAPCARRHLVVADPADGASANGSAPTESAPPPTALPAAPVPRTDGGTRGN